MNFIDYTILIFYMLGVFGVGFFLSSKNNSTEDMFAAGGESPWWTSGLSSFMTMFSAGTFVVWGGIAYEHGIVAVVINICYGVAAITVGYFVAGKWKNCTEGVHLTSHITDICTTVHEVMLSESVKDYLAVEAKITLSGMQMAETTGLFLTFQTLLRVCRLTINDILGARVSVWEFLLAWLTAVRLITAAVVSGMNFQDFASDGFFFALFSMWAATFVIIIIVARDAEIAVRMEKARNKEKAKHNETILQRRKLSRKQSVKVIMARPRRRTSVASNKSSAAAFARQERLSMDQVNSAKKAAKVIKRKASLLAKKRFEVPKNLEGQLHPALLNMVKEQEKQLE